MFAVLTFQIAYRRFQLQGVLQVATQAIPEPSGRLQECSARSKYSRSRTQPMRPKHMFLKPKVPAWIERACLKRWQVAIHWYLDGHLQRQSGGKIPKGAPAALGVSSRVVPWDLAGHGANFGTGEAGGFGCSKPVAGFSMFVDNLRDPVPGQWSARLTDVTSGHRRPSKLSPWCYLSVESLSLPLRECRDGFLAAGLESVASSFMMPAMWGPWGPWELACRRL